MLNNFVIVLEANLTFSDSYQVSQFQKTTFHSRQEAWIRFEYCHCEESIYSYSSRSQKNLSKTVQDQFNYMVNRLMSLHALLFLVLKTCWGSCINQQNYWPLCGCKLKWVNTTLSIQRISPSSHPRVCKKCSNFIIH